MTIHREDEWLTVHGGDNRDVLKTLPAESVQCVISSPPYWGLRDYGTAAWDGGDADCDHAERRWDGPKQTQGAQSGHASKADQLARRQCSCGATRVDRQLGLESSPDDYVAAMVDVFREVRRVLRKDGTLWLNLGDSYAGSWGAQSRGGPPSESSTLKGNGHIGGGPKLKGMSAVQIAAHPKRTHTGSIPSDSTLKPKDLVGIPWRVAFALQADGWYLRSDIIWSKPNPMPESVTDRPTKAHEYLFLLSKSAVYHYDADAIREPHRWQDPVLLATNAQARQGARLAERRAAGDESAVRTQPELGREKGRGKNGNAESEFSSSVAGRNKRSVWTIATKPYPGAHFATFPEALVEPCILAGTSAAGACATCGAPWERVVERTVENRRAVVGHINKDRNDSGASVNADRTYTTTGWQRTCDHEGEPVPCAVMDPFGGTGTVGLVANRLSRRAVLIDLNPDYLTQCLERNRQSPLGLVV